MGRNRRKISASKARYNARRRGAEFEKRVARLLGGTIHPGLDGDVSARGYMLECKYRHDLTLQSTSELREFHEQIERYRREHWPRGQRYALVYTGGKSFNNAQIYVSIPIEEFERLTRENADRQELDHFFDKYPDWRERVLNLIQSLAIRLSQEIRAEQSQLPESDAELA